MVKRRWLMAVPFAAAAIVALTTESVRAFTRETVTPNGNYNFNYGSLDDKKSGDSANKSDPNSPGFHFNAQQGQSGALHSFGGANAPPSQPYFRTFGN
jgi:hypothetical protein